jgi:hypothetical protein
MHVDPNYVHFITNCWLVGLFSKAILKLNELTSSIPVDDTPRGAAHCTGSSIALPSAHLQQMNACMEVNPGESIDGSTKCRHVALQTPALIAICILFPRPPQAPCASAR